MKLYLLSLLGGAVGALLLFVLALQALATQGILPAPQFSNSQCVDEKLRAMRFAALDDTNLLVVGSSVALRHFSGAAARELDPKLRPYNAGFCHANVLQTNMSTRWLLQRLPHTRHVILVASPFDFQNCSSGSATQFSLSDADEYVFGDDSPLLPYLKYFDPPALVRNALNVRQVRTDRTIFDSVVITPSGDGPSAPPWRGLHYGPAEPEDACFDALADLAGWLDRKSVRFDVTLTPIHPNWIELHGGETFSHLLHQRIRSRLEGTDGRFLPHPHGIAERDFYDAIHLRMSSTRQFTQGLIRVMQSSFSDGTRS